MFNEKNLVKNDMYDFIKIQGITGGSYGLDVAMGYLTLIESRITNNLMLINNPALCSQFGLNVNDLYAELENLMVIRQKISFSDKTYKKTR